MHIGSVKGSWDIHWKRRIMFVWKRIVGNLSLKMSGLYWQFVFSCLKLKDFIVFTFWTSQSVNYAFKQSPSQLAWLMYIGDVCTLLVCYFNISLSRSASLFCRVLSMLIEEGVEDIVVYLSCPSYFFLFKKRKVKKFIKAFMSNAYENTLIFALLFFFNLPVNLCVSCQGLCAQAQLFIHLITFYSRGIYT